MLLQYLVDLLIKGEKQYFSEYRYSKNAFKRILKKAGYTIIDIVYDELLPPYNFGLSVDAPLKVYFRSKDGVEFKINKGIEIYDDAIASIKTEGLIGDKYVAVDPGGGGDLLANGDSITDTNSPTDIMDLVSKYAFGDVGEGDKEE